MEKQPLDSGQTTEPSEAEPTPCTRSGSRSPREASHALRCEGRDHGCEPPATSQVPQEGEISALSGWQEGFIERVREPRSVLKDESRFAGWQRGGLPSTEVQRKGQRGGCCGTGCIGHPEREAQGLCRQGQTATQGRTHSQPFMAPPTLPPLWRPGFYGIFPCCQPGQSPAGQGPGRVRRRKGSGVSSWEDSRPLLRPGYEFLCKDQQDTEKRCSCRLSGH